MTQRRSSGRTAITLLLLGLAASCGGPEPETTDSGAEQQAHQVEPRVLMIGVDGASKRLIESMRKEGLLPNLDAIAREGSSGVAVPSGFLLSPPIWTTVATGKRREKHGIEKWAKPDGNQEIRLYSSRDRRVHALWNIASDAGYSVAVVNWLMTQPPEEINGVMISDHAAEARSPNPERVVDRSEESPNRTAGAGATDAESIGEVGFTYPVEWQSRLDDLRKGKPVTEIPDPFSSERGWRGKSSIHDFFRRMYLNDAFAARTALEIEKKIRPDLMLVYFPGIDRISHVLWHSVEPVEAIPEQNRASKMERAVHGGALRLYYRYVDAMIGRLLEGRSAEDLVIVLSDHGFELDLSGSHPRGTHVSNAARDGILYMRGRGVPRGRSDLRMKMAQFTPTVLTWMGMPTAMDMDSGPAEFIDSAPTGQIATYDRTPIRIGGARDNEVESRIIDDLRELGYVE